jgi:inorganic pyrophosphatase
MEINKLAPYNPVKQDLKDDVVRHVTFGDLPFNYGAFPQTWEDPNIKNTIIGHAVGGDNDPLDVIELSETPIKMGKVSIVKILGCIPLIDSQEVDWKILVIDVNSPLAEQMNDVTDIEEERLSAITYWLRMYKTSDGKPQNVIALEGRAQNRDYCLNIIEENHERWKWLMKNGAKNIWTGDVNEIPSDQSDRDTVILEQTPVRDEL